MKEVTRDKMIAAGIRALKEFGYELVTAETILTDEVYRAAFVSMLRANRGYSPTVDYVIDSFLVEIEKKE